MLSTDTLNAKRKKQVQSLVEKKGYIRKAETKTTNQRKHIT